MNQTTQYVSLAIKYRPTNLAELKAQEVLSKIISYAIENNRIAQSYLLTGIRGVGKTSSARIIARTINCTDRVKQSENIVPCGHCKNCHAFSINAHPDIVEIDAASKTGVDDMREILKSCEYKPLLAKYKVFIIDEVHMLSKSAFNALLKILEEPPPHVIFIFATTEVQKIPLTIISRCQRYDLRRFSFDEILVLLKHIVDQENLLFSEDALKIIAFRSEGSARDAITILDQVANLSTDDKQQAIDAEIINRMLGLVATGSVVEFVHKILLSDADGSLKMLNDFYNTSISLEHLIEYASELVVYCCKKKLLINYSLPLYESFDLTIQDMIERIELSQLSILWQIFQGGLQAMKSAHNLLIATEMLIIKAIYSQSLPRIEDLLSDTELPRQA